MGKKISSATEPICRARSTARRSTARSLRSAESLRQASREGGTAILDAAIELARQAGIEAKTVLLEADWRHFSAAIVEEALPWSAELIVLGTHGRTGLARLVLGSVAEGVIHIAPVPVPLVRHHRGAAG